MPRYGVDIVMLVSFVVEADSPEDAEREAFEHTNLLDAVHRGNYEYSDYAINLEEEDDV